MKDATRLIDQGADDFEAGLLRSAERDGGDARAVERTLAAIGVAALATTVVHAVTGSGAPAATAPASATGAGVGGAAGLGGAAAGLGRLTASSATTGIVGLTLGVAIGLAIPFAPGRGRVDTAKTAMALTVSQARPIDAEGVHARAPQEVQAPAEPEQAAPIVAARPPAVVARPLVPDAPVGSASPVAPRPRGISLSEEVALLDRARGALAQGDGARALRALDVYDAACPAGALAPEARVLRVEALVKSGDRRRAAEVAAPMLEGASPHERRVRSVLEKDD
jgi:hypothetical protein